MTWTDWLRLPWDAAWRLVMKDEGLELSGYIAFTAFLSLFPFLIFLAALAGFLGDQETASEFIDAMFRFMPNDVAETLAPAVRDVIGSRQGGLLTFGVLGTLWFASSGIEALRAGLNRAYGVNEERPIWWLRLQSLAMVIVSGFVFFFVSIAVILGPIVWEAVRPVFGRTLDAQIVFTTGRYVVAVILLWSSLMLLHRWLPNSKQAYLRVLPGVCVTVVLLWAALMLLHRWLPNTRQAYLRVLPGVCATTLLWLAGASLFSWYVGNLADYSAFYGSLGGVAITLFFFYGSAIIFIFGGELNAVWRERTGRRRAPKETNGDGADAEA